MAGTGNMKSLLVKREANTGAYEGEMGYEMTETVRKTEVGIINMVWGVDRE